jgi:hypothetical protein
MSVKDNSMSEETNNEDNNNKSDVNDVLSNIGELNLILNKLENIEQEKNNLKTELKKYEKFFISKKEICEKKYSQISKEIKMFEKAITIIKNLKDF